MVQGGNRVLPPHAARSPAAPADRLGRQQLQQQEGQQQVKPASHVLVYIVRMKNHCLYCRKIVYPPPQPKVAGLVQTWQMPGIKIDVSQSLLTWKKL